MKISVIIPVYRVEKYLDRCIMSIVNQTYNNLEIILVDDGSPDSCPKLCDNWSIKDKRVKVIHKKNGGLSSARNAGLEIATGDFVSFVDSDDWLDLDTYEYCISLLKQTQSDCIQFDFFHTSSEKLKPKLIKEKIRTYTGKAILQFYMDSTTRRGGYSVCICLFRLSIAKKYKFREGKINEDMDYKFKILRDSRQMTISNFPKYFYWQEGNSISSGKLQLKDFQLYEAAEELYKLCKEEDYGNICFLGKVKKARTPLSLLCKLSLWGIDNSSLNENETIKKLITDNRKSLPILLRAPIPFNRKLLAILFSVDYRIAKYVITLGKSMMKYI